MADNGIRVVTTDVGDRYVLEALRREGGILGGEQSGHLIWLDGHVTGDGLVAALLLCNALHGRPLAEVAAVMPRFPQAKENVSRHLRRGPLNQAVEEEVARLNAELGRQRPGAGQTVRHGAGDPGAGRGGNRPGGRNPLW